MSRLTELAKQFQTKLAQQADRAAPKLIDPNAGPKNSEEAKASLEAMQLQDVGTAVIADLAEALGMKNLTAGDIKFTKLRFVTDNNRKSIEWGMAVSPNASAQFNAGVANMRKSTATFSVPRYVTQLFGQKLPGVPVLPAQPIMIG